MKIKEQEKMNGRTAIDVSQIQSAHEKKQDVGFRAGRVFADCLRKNAGFIIFFVITLGIFFAVFYLYDICIEPFAYAAVICAFIGLVCLLVDFLRCVKKAKLRSHSRNAILTEWQDLPDAESLEERDYQEMLETMGRELEKIASECSVEREDMVDYYTTWVHQIKTPIAVLKMQLSADANPSAKTGLSGDNRGDELCINSADDGRREALAELFRIEQYVDMVLQYIRLGSSTNDLLIREYRLDELIRESIRKFASQFVLRKLRLNYTPTDRIIITDKKWFCCILDQLLSNAIKYTPSGEIRIAEDALGRLYISDTGIGIAPEDVPRIFEKGFTGRNGRLSERKSSGLGLYLAKRAACMIHIPISVESPAVDTTAWSSIDVDTENSGIEDALSTTKTGKPSSMSSSTSPGAGTSSMSSKSSSAPPGAGTTTRWTADALSSSQTEKSPSATPGVGTTFILDLSQIETRYE